MNKYYTYFTLFSVFLLTALPYAWGQKKAIDHTAYAKWETLKNTKVSEQGNFISYEIQPLKGDTYLYVFNVQTGTLDSIHRAKSAQFSKDEKWMIFAIETGYDTLRKLELEKVNKKKWPKDSIGIFNLLTSEIKRIPQIKEYQFDENHNVLAYLLHTNDELVAKKEKEKSPQELLTGKALEKFLKKEAKEAKKLEKIRLKNERKGIFVEEEEEVEKPSSDGKRLHVLHLDDSTEYVQNNVDGFKVFDNGNYFVYLNEENKEKSIVVYDLIKCTSTAVEGKYGEVTHFKKHPFKDEIVFLASADTSETKVFELFHYNIDTQTKTCLVDSTLDKLPLGKTVVDSREMYFSKSMNNILFFYVNDIPRKAPKDTLVASEKVKVDVWHYEEPILKTMQLARLKRDQKKADLYGYNFDNNEVYLLSNDTLSLDSDHREVSEWTLGKNTVPYQLSSMWDYNSRSDLYRVNLKTGEKELIVKGKDDALDLSRQGDKLITFDGKTAQYYVTYLPSNVTKCLTCQAKGRNWSSDVNGMPMDANPRQAFGFDQSGKVYYMADEFDVFGYDFEKEELINLSGNKGKLENKEFRFQSLWSDSSYVDLNRTYLQVFDRATKGSEIYEYKNGGFEKTVAVDAQIAFFNKSKDGSVRVMRKNTIKDYSNLEISKNNEDFEMISTANTHQAEYKWATVELIKWKSYKGLELEGLIYKPEDFDATKSYPMIVYYYETYSESLHAYHGARPTASIVHPTEYASNDYIIFIPDIYYKSGYPARGAYDCIMSGTDAVLKKYPNIDKNRMGLQGQSWGGYQTAMLITMTDRFKAAMAGAPVSNMFSAFGGIRWGTGMSRMGQYEKGQSRIGKTIWEAPELYVENSPLFHIPKIKTPLLIMANDQDGAVPWYQGIEMFMGMRRLLKPVWMLNYNGDDHNLMKTANRYDLSIRMMQFFDHYLKNAAIPLWMKEGVPALVKDKEMGYELVEE